MRVMRTGRSGDRMCKLHEPVLLHSPCLSLLSLLEQVEASPVKPNLKDMWDAQFVRMTNQGSNDLPVSPRVLNGPMGLRWIQRILTLSATGKEVMKNRLKIIVKLSDDVV